MNTNKQVRTYLNTISLKKFGQKYSSISEKKAKKVRDIGMRLLK